MKRPVITAMSALSVAVIGLSLRTSTEGQTAALPIAASGIVTPAQRAPTAAAPAPLPSAAVSASTAAPGAGSPTAGASRTARQPTIVGPAAAAPAAPTTSSALASHPVSHPPAPTPSRPPRTVTVNGTPASTHYGPVQVQITLTNGRITAANAITYPRYDRREQQINDPAIPQLNQETLQAQSANIDTVSGATYTSAGYQQSLQSALDTAHAG